ncbi:MAG TPA: YidC/Oxa1 family insertase periplasmic-domain containing protein [Pirellulales bacterium]|nr:YidC/Oxa1 family insertase periplasmic-domain containing protein [Pirellulales bacterium]
MERRLVSFLAISLLILIGSVYLENLVHPPKPVNQQNQVAQNENGGKGAANEKAAPKAGERGANPPEANAPAVKPAEKTAPGEKPAPPRQNPPVVGPQQPPAEEAIDIAPQWFTLGSLTPATAGGKYEMLVTLTNRGAAVERVEMSNPKYGDLDNRNGYLGRLALALPAKGSGCIVNVVGDGTPAAAAGLKPGDKITGLDSQSIESPQALVDALNTTKPGQQVELSVLSDGKKVKLAATLGRYPLSVISPEANTDPLDILPPPTDHDPLSLLLTLHQADDDTNDTAGVNDEIAGLHLRDGLWQAKRTDPNTVEFTRRLPRWDLELVKRFTLAEIGKNPAGASAPAYHLILHVEVRNTGKKSHEVAYQLDGATGLPTEGWWYSYRISHDWSGLALRDVALKFHGSELTLDNSMPLAAQKEKEIEAKKNGQTPPKDEATKPVGPELPEAPLAFAGVDAQYFASALIPQNEAPQGQKFKPWFSEVRAMIVGEVPKDVAVRRKVDCTCRLTSALEVLDPGKKIEHDYQVFIGPKQPALLDQYGGGVGNDLSPLVYYGWFALVAQPMVAILEIFHWLVGNYGIAILMLTILVRLCMFPLSRKQALSAKKMQELQPEMKKINEKYKTNAEQRTRAMQELWKKHNYNPMGGCLLVFVQLPIFMGLYRSLMVNIELRQASLLGEGVRWCSNLAAPDMFWNWRHTIPPFLSGETAWLGPYLNILPILTVALFVWQQSMFMPPATDDNTALQQKIMKFMTLGMGFLYFKVASGLCLYFIASSMWGIAERKLLPKTLPPGGSNPAAASESRSAAIASTNGQNGSSRSANKKKQRGRNG